MAKSKTVEVSPGADMNKIVKAYLKIRDAKTALTREFEEQKAGLDSKLDLLENHMLKFLNEHKMESAKAGAATFYRQEEVTPAASDWETVYAWIVKNDAFEMLEKRLKKTFVKEYMEAHGKIPPGVTVHRQFVVRVRRGDGK